LKHAIPSLKLDFVQIEYNTRGAAESALIATNKIEREAPLVFLDGDSLHTENVLGKCRDFFYGDEGERDPTSLAVFCKRLANPAPIFSFVRFDESSRKRNGTQVTSIAEKTVISDNICIGIYCFPSVQVFRKFAGFVIDEGLGVKGEFYMSQVYARALRDAAVSVFGILVTDYVSVGTPSQVWEYLNKSKDDPSAPTYVKGLRVCFDLDNTLVTYPRVKGDYTTVEPIPHVVAVAQQLKEAGCEIIIHTARRMATHKDNVGKVIKDQGRIIIETLEKFNIPYDELYFGKPLADFYVDDRAVNPFLRLTEEMGIHHEDNPMSLTSTNQETKFLAVPPRSFHSLKINPDTVSKSGHSAGIDPQVAYYESLPISLRGFFPTLLSKTAERGTTTFVLSRAKGASLSYIYIFGTLTQGLFDELVDSLVALHSWVPTSPDEKEKFSLPTDATVYLNWAPKMHQRWHSRFSDCYRFFAQSELVVPRINWWLEMYQRYQKGVPAYVIHGDAVFTNCVAAADKPRIKWVDMKGLLGSARTTAGDVNYDWSKILQSLLGYDYILLGKPNTAARDYPNLLSHFQEFYIRRFGKEAWAWLYMLTASFMFALLPQHLDQPAESQTFYRMGVKWLAHAEALLREHGMIYAQSNDPNVVPCSLDYAAIFPGEETEP
jgi:capsule biosynthesis phosphatase